MHIKVLFGLFVLAVASASPKPAAKPSPQYYPGAQQVNYVPVGANNFQQGYSGQSVLSQPFGYYNVRASNSYTPSLSGSAIPVPVQVNPQTFSGNYYQQIPVPVTYSQGNPFSTNVAQPSNYYGAARLWPKSFINPSGTPVPTPEPVYVSSTPSPFAYQSSGSYFKNFPVSTPSPQVQSLQPIPVPVSVGARSSFLEKSNYNIAPVAQNIPVPVSTVSPYPANYYQQPTAAPQVFNYQQPTVNPYLNNYYQQSTPVPYSANYQRIPVPVAYPYNSQIYSQATKPTYTVAPTVSYPTVPVTTQTVTYPTTTPKTVTITQKSAFPTTAIPIIPPKPVVLKTEYKTGAVFPEYAQYSPMSYSSYPHNYSYGSSYPYYPKSIGQYNPLSYAHGKPVSAYYPSTAVSHVNYHGQGTNYSY